MTERTRHGLVPGRPIFHFTCDHGFGLLGDGEVTLTRAYERMVADGRTPVWNATVVWLTDLAHPDPRAIGVGNLTGRLTCDRTAHRYRVLDTDSVLWWPRAARRLEVTATERADIEGALDVRPAHWYVSLSPVRAAYDPR